MRINRFFTANGICSRREADHYIEDGRVRIVGSRGDKVAVLGDQLEDGDQVYLDGKLMESQSTEPVVIAYNKPVGVECTSDPRVQDNIIVAVNYHERLFHVGRLDKMSEGLILLTNIGDFVNAALRKAHRHEKEYHVWLNGEISDDSIEAFARGVDLDDGPTLPCKVVRLAPNKISMTLIEGRNRQIRRMVESIGLKTGRLMRVRFMNVQLGMLKYGEWRKVQGPELAMLLRLAGLQMQSDA